MEFSLILLSKLISMMLMAIVGYVLVKLDVLHKEDSRAISVLLVYVLQPCLVLHSLQIELTPNRLHGFIFGTVFAFLSMFLSILFAGAVRKPLHLDGIDRASLTYANVGNLIMPLVSMALGDEMVFYCSVFQISFHVLVWTHGISIIREDTKPELKKILLNPSIIALALGIFFLVTQIRIPSVIDSAIVGFYNMVGASSMLLIGMVIAGSDLRSVFTYRKAYLISFLRLLFLPVLCMLLLYLTGLIPRHPELRDVSMVIMITAAAPTGSMIVQLAVVHDKDAVKASIYNVMSTILCVVTIPLVVLLFQLMFPV